MTIKINLLPWRSQARLRQKNSLYVLFLSVLVLGVVVVYLMNVHMDQLIHVQAQHNFRLREAITQLNQQVKDTNMLQDKRKIIIARTNKITRVLSHRTASVNLFDELVKVIPAEVYLTQLERTKEQVLVLGSADSNDAISTMMRNIELNPWFCHSRLTEIKKLKTLRHSAEYQFKLNFILKRA